MSYDIDRALATVTKQHLELEALRQRDTELVSVIKYAVFWLDDAEFSNRAEVAAKLREALEKHKESEG